jgi:hypothetical protein
MYRWRKCETDLGWGNLNLDLLTSENDGSSLPVSLFKFVFVPILLFHEGFF